MRVGWFYIQCSVLLPLSCVVCIVPIFAQTPEKNVSIEAATALPASRSDTPGTGWALLVGVGDYQPVDGFTITKLTAPGRDVIALEDFLIDPALGAFPAENVVTLVDAAATKDAIQFALADLSVRAGPDDLVLFYFSGHGYRKSGEEDDGSEAYLVPYVTARQALQNPRIGCIKYEDIIDIVDDMQAAKMVTILDACHSGGVKSRGKAISEDIYQRFWDEWGHARGRALLMSSDETQESVQELDGSISVFTRFLIQGLSGEADADDNAIVGFTELALYLEREVPPYTLQRFKKKQTPTRRYDSGAINGDIPLSVNQAKWNAQQHQNLLSKRIATILVDLGLTAELGDFCLKVAESAYDKTLAGQTLTQRETALLKELDAHIAGTLSVNAFTLRAGAIYSKDEASTEPMAKLSLEVAPASAIVKVTPIDLPDHDISAQSGGYRVSKGDYRVSVTLNGYRPHAETISVDADLSRTITLAPLMGRLHISVTPADASVEVTPVSVPAKTADSKTLRVGRPEDGRELPVGAYRVAATKQGYQSEERASVSVRADEVTSVDLSLKGYATIRYVNTPEGVTATVNGITHDLPVQVLEGAHAIELQREGYEPVELSPTLAPLEVIDLSPEWKRILVAFSVRSNPAGATVTLDGSQRGKTPITLRDVPAGDHELQVALADHEPVTQTLALAAQPKPVVVTLERSRGTVRIVSTPPGAAIRIGTREYGVTPTTVETPVGRVTVNLDKPLYRSAGTDVRIQRGQNAQITVALEAQEATLTIASTPPGATVRIAGQQESNETPAQVTLPPGSHEVTISLDDHEPHTETVTLADSDTKEVRATLLHETQLYITSDPSGVEVALGNMGKHRTPALLRDVRPGRYEATASSQGYGSIVKPFTVGPNRRNTIELILSPKSRSAMALRSALLPGLGQFSGGRPGAGALFLLATVGAGVASGISHSQYDTALSDYHDALNRHASATQVDEIESAKQDTLTAFDDVDARFSQRRLALVSMGALWGANVLHALVAGPARPSVGDAADSNLARWAVEPRLTRDGSHVVLNHRF